MINLLRKKAKRFENINAEVFQQKLANDKEGVLVDVRTETEYSEGHIPNSLLIDIKAQDFSERIEKLDKTKTYYMYCRSGARSATACKIMAEKGFKKLFNLSSGILGWKGSVEK